MIECEMPHGDCMRMDVVVMQLGGMIGVPEVINPEQRGLRPMLKISVLLQSSGSVVMSVHPTENCFCSPDSTEKQQNDPSMKKIAAQLDCYAMEPADRAAVLQQIEEFLRAHSIKRLPDSTI